MILILLSFLIVNQSGHGGTKVSLPNFENRSKNYFTSTPSDKGLGTENPRILGI